MLRRLTDGCPVKFVDDRPLHADNAVVGDRQRPRDCRVRRQSPPQRSRCSCLSRTYFASVFDLLVLTFSFHKLCRNQGHRLLGSKIEWKQTDRRTRPIALLSAFVVSRGHAQSDLRWYQKSCTEASTDIPDEICYREIWVSVRRQTCGYLPGRRASPPRDCSTMPRPVRPPLVPGEPGGSRPRHGRVLHALHIHLHHAQRLGFLGAHVPRRAVLPDGQLSRPTSGLTLPISDDNGSHFLTRDPGDPSVN